MLVEGWRPGPIVEMVEPSKEFRIAYKYDGKPMKSMTGFKQWNYRIQSVFFKTTLASGWKFGRQE